MVRQDDCGKELRQGAKFCDGCGTPVREEDTPSDEIKKIKEDISNSINEQIQHYAKTGDTSFIDKENKDVISVNVNGKLVGISDILAKALSDIRKVKPEDVIEITKSAILDNMN